jgi:4-hydroxy-3-polyprenylbenzoate decarboxylase
MGAMVAPPVPPFYARPQTLDDMVREMAARVLSWLGVDPGPALTRWQGL